MLKQDLMPLNYELERPLPTGKNKRVIGLMEDKLGGKNKNVFCIESENTELVDR